MTYGSRKSQSQPSVVFDVADWLNGAVSDNNVPEATLEQAIGLDPVYTDVRRLIYVLLDPFQPRQNIIPAALRQQVLNSSKSAADAMQELIAEVLRKQPEFAAYKAVLAVNDVASLPELSFELVNDPAVRAFAGVFALALSIRLAGLQYPPRVVAVDERLVRLVDGERRFWAHVLLAVAGAASDEMPVTVVELREATMLQQVSATGAHKAFNAVQTARALALLLLEYYGVQRPQRPTWEWYAQAADAERFRMPRGSLAAFAGMVGLPANKTVISKYRSILRMDAESAMLAEAYDVPERQLRALMQKGFPGETFLVELKQLLGLESVPPAPQSEANPAKILAGVLRGKAVDVSRLSQEERRILSHEVQVAKKRLTDFERELR